MDLSLFLLLCAWLVDVAWGEYPNRMHPVVWMGAVITRFQSFWLGRSPTVEKIGGICLLLVVTLGFGALATASLYFLRSWPWIHFILAIFWLKSSFALRALGEAATHVRRLLDQNALDMAREKLNALCSRDARELDREQLAEASISSLAENLSDSVIAPLFYFAIGGVPAAVMYRAVNTLDAMVGYKNHFKHFGWASARFDDLLNWIPARITALLLFLAGLFLRFFHFSAWATAWRDHGKTPSPNGGWPMAAMAGLLRVSLRKPGVYTLGTALRPSDTSALSDAWRLTRLAASLGFVATLLALLSGVGL